MILASGLYGNPAPNPANPHKPKLPTPAQRRNVEAWAGCALAGASLRQLQIAHRVVNGHPDAHAPGYSRAKATRERLEAELATRS